MPQAKMTVERFGGLNLALDPAEVGLAGSVDLKNVEISAGIVRTRNGSTSYDTNTATGACTFNYLNSLNAAGLFAAGYSYGATAVAAVFGLASVTNTVTAAVTSAVGFSTPTASFVMFMCSDATAYQYNYSTWSTVSASLPDGTLLGVTPLSNRLVVTGGTTNPGRVHFSDPDAQTTFTAGNHVDLADGVGQPVAWDDRLFIPGTSEWAVFGGESIDASGGAIFNYRTITAAGYPRAACAGPDGVYYSTPEGVFRTTGGPSVKVSGALDNWFLGRPPAVWTGRTRRTSSGVDKMTSTGTHLYFLHGTTSVSTQSLFVMEYKTGAWTYWEVPTVYIAGGRVELRLPGALFYAASGESDIARVYRLPEYDDTVYTQDGSTAIASHYQSGPQYPADGRQARLHGFRLYGSGTASLSLAVNGAAANQTAGPVSGAGPERSVALTAAGAYVPSGALARAVGFRLGATSGAWSLSRLEADVRGARGR